jgi:hypothetical protein
MDFLSKKVSSYSDASIVLKLWAITTSPVDLLLLFPFVEISMYGKTVSIILIGRRSRYMAGARFLKRGINCQGHVANDVETEQILVSYLPPRKYHPYYSQTQTLQPHENKKLDADSEDSDDSDASLRVVHGNNGVSGASPNPANIAKGRCSETFRGTEFSSFVQIRGSIPLHWAQDNSIITPKPNVISK